MLNQINLKYYQGQIFQDKNRFRAVAAGRRFGKTYELFFEILTEIIKNGHIITYATPTRDMFLKIMLPVLLKYLPNEIYSLNRTLWQFTFINGSILNLASTNHYDTAFRGQSNDLLIFDEVKDTEYEAWSEAAFPTLSDRQGRALLVGTPDGNTWFKDICYSSDFSFHQYKTLQGGYVPQSEIEIAKRQLDERTFKQEYEASFESYSNLAYYTYSTANNTNIEFDNNADTFLCWDFNATSKPMACIIVQKKDNKYYAVKEFVIKYTNTEQMCEIVKEYLLDKNFIGKIDITGDNSGNATKSVSSAAAKTDYIIIEHFFKNFKGYDKTTRATRSIKDRVNSLCALFRSLTGEIRAYVNQKQCPKLHKDLLRVEFMANGRQLDDRNDNDTHASDAFSYLAYNFERIDFAHLEYYDG
jgi:hypothetical protein